LKIDISKYDYGENDFDYDAMLDEIQFNLKRMANEYFRAGINNEEYLEDIETTNELL